MARKPFSPTLLEEALKATGEALEYPSEVEILIVGGAAGMLTGLLPPARTTFDCDVMVFVPAQAWHAVEQAGKRIARAMGLAPTWLNGEAGEMFRYRLPNGWEDRRRAVGRFGRLNVYAVGRADLIAMKIVAGRPQDREDLAQLRPTPAELEFVGAYLDSLVGRGADERLIDDARVLLDSLEVRA